MRKIFANIARENAITTLSLNAGGNPDSGTETDS